MIEIVKKEEDILVTAVRTLTDYILTNDKSLLNLCQAIVDRVATQSKQIELLQKQLDVLMDLQLARKDNEE